MDYRLALFLLGIALFLWSFKKPKRSAIPDNIWADLPPVATLAKIPELFQRLATKGEHGHFVTFVVPAKESPEHEVRFRLANQRGVLSFDWLLDGEGNQKDRPHYEALAKSLGHAPREAKEDGREVLRTEDKDLVALCVLVLRDLYQVNEDDEIKLEFG